MRCAEAISDDRAYRPFRGDPFPGRMRKNGREAKEAGLFIDFRRLDGRDLMPAKALADNVQPARQRGIAEGAVGFTGEGGPDGAQRAISPDSSAPPGLWRARRKCCRLYHWSGAWLAPSMLRTSKLTAPDFERLARTPCPIASLASSGMRPLSSALAFSCSR